MKKVILMLLLILPVVIALLAFAIGSFVGRAVKLEFIENAFIAEQDRTAFEGEGYETHAGDYGNNMYRISTVRGAVHELEKFFTVVPSRAKFSDLVFVYSNNEDNYNAVEIKNGKLYINKNRRTSDNKTSHGIEIKAMADIRTIFTLYVDILLTGETENYFDYLGFDYSRFSDNDYVEISKAADLPMSTEDLRNLVISGLDTARYDLVYWDFDSRDEFVNSLELSITEIPDLAVGEDIEINVSATWKGTTLTCPVKLKVVA